MSLVFGFWFRDLNRQLITNGPLVYTEAITWNVWAVHTRRAPRAVAVKDRANSASSAPIPVRTPICGSTVANLTPRGISGSATTIQKKDSTGKNTVEPLASATGKSTRNSDASKRRDNLKNQPIVKWKEDEQTQKNKHNYYFKIKLMKKMDC